jgi:xanthine/CO dehydrogenase XdhC/CoxF family maturation factor
MNEQRTIVDKWRQGMASILLSLVRVQGSSYRRPGARLLLCKDGSYEGNISAGCLEADLLRKAAWLVRKGVWSNGTPHCSRREPISRSV